MGRWYSNTFSLTFLFLLYCLYNRCTNIYTYTKNSQLRMQIQTTTLLLPSKPLLSFDFFIATVDCRCFQLLLVTVLITLPLALRVSFLLSLNYNYYDCNKYYHCYCCLVVINTVCYCCYFWFEINIIICCITMISHV